MIKELKFFFYILIISLSIFFTLKYYFSDNNKKKSYRSLNTNNQKILNFAKKLVILPNDTNNIVEYIEKIEEKNKKKYNFWNLINNND